MADVAGAYREARQRIGALVGGLTPDDVQRAVPATPEWRVKDVLAHLVGVSADITAGNLDGVASDPWTAKQVVDRRDRTVSELLTEWDEHAPTVEAMVPQFPEIPAAAMLLTDVATHEHDLRGALGAPGARDSSALATGFGWIVRSVSGVRLETDAGAFVPEDGEPSSTVRASRFELFRAYTGRRSLDQMAAYDWEGEPRPEALLGPIFTPRPTPLDE